jgi:hypothetical protein
VNRPRRIAASQPPAIVTILLIAVIPLAQTILDSLFQISLRFENAPRSSSDSPTTVQSWATTTGSTRCE